MIAMFGGAAGSGKTTIARKWCLSRTLAVHIEFDEIRDLIVAGRADPQVLTELQAAQYEVTVRACCALARTFADAGYDVAIDEGFGPEETLSLWKPALEDRDARLVILHPSLKSVLQRGASRAKHVLEEHVLTQHASVGRWPVHVRVDSSLQSIEETVQHASQVLTKSSLRQLATDMAHNTSLHPTSFADG